MVYICLDSNHRTNFELSRETSIKLELALNKSDKGKIWSHVGDKLYNYGIGKESMDKIITSNEIFFYLYKLAVENNIII